MREAVFVAITTEHPIYSNYLEIDEEKRGTVIPLMLMMNRWDGLIGFPGGTKEQNECSITTALREVKEEINFELSDHSLLKIVSEQYDNTKNLKTYLYSLHTDFNTFNNILKKQHEAEHFLTEGSLFAVHCINYSHKASFSTFLKHNFPLTVKEQIDDLFDHLKWKERFDLHFDII